MIRIAVMYPNVLDEEFNVEYYQNKHLPLVKQAYEEYGLVSVELDVAVSKLGRNAAPYLAIAYLTFNDMPAFLDAIKNAGKVVNEDVKDFTNTQPTIQISESITC